MFWSIVKKEFKNFFRDKKGLYGFILMPIIMSFYLFGINVGVEKLAHSSGNKKDYNVNLVVKSSEANDSLVNAIKNVDNSINFTVSEEKQVSNTDSEHKKFNLVIELPQGFSKELKDGKHIEVKVYKSAIDVMDNKYEKLMNAISQYEKDFVNSTLVSNSIDIKVLDSYDVKMVNVGEVDEQQAMMFYLIPFMLLLFPMTITMQLVNELCVTEKERGTLEAILCTRASRKTIFGAKYFTLCVLVIAEIFISFSFMVIAGKVLKTNIINMNILNGNRIIIIFALVIIAFICISLMQFCIGVYGKNYKETQSLLAPFVAVATLLPMAFMFLDAKNINAVFFHIPFLNLVSIINELFLGISNVMHITTVLIWQIIYMLIAIFVTLKVVSNETILFRK